VKKLLLQKEEDEKKREKLLLAKENANNDLLQKKEILEKQLQEEQTRATRQLQADKEVCPSFIQFFGSFSRFLCFSLSLKFSSFDRF
jgi:hypothetical protein